jgi:hypothetical protein
MAVVAPEIPGSALPTESFAIAANPHCDKRIEVAYAFGWFAGGFDAHGTGEIALQSVSGCARYNAKETVCDHDPAKKIWTRPELMRLGSIPDVAGSIGDTTQGGKLVRS